MRLNFQSGRSADLSKAGLTCLQSFGENAWSTLRRNRRDMRFPVKITNENAAGPNSWLNSTRRGDVHGVYGSSEVTFIPQNEKLSTSSVHDVFASSKYGYDAHKLDMAFCFCMFEYSERFATCSSLMQDVSIASVSTGTNPLHFFRLASSPFDPF